MSDSQQPLIIKDWDGIASSPHEGFGLFKNVDLLTSPGSVKVNKKPGTIFHDIEPTVFVVNTSSDNCTATPASDFENNGRNYGGAAVYLTTTGTLPTGLSTGTVYFMIYVNDQVCQLASSYDNAVGSNAGTQIDITGAGSGTHTINPLPIGTIKWMVKDPRTDNLFMLDSNGRTWYVPDTDTAYLLHNSAIENVTGALTQASGNGLAITPFSSTTQTFLFTFRNNAIDVIDVFGTTQIEAVSWTNSWQTMNTGTSEANSHEAIVAQDEAIYFCDDRYVGRIIEKVGQTFVPGTAGTYTYSNQALDLPPYEIAQCMDEHGVNLMIGGQTFNKIYPWNRRASTFNLPIEVPENNIRKIKNKGGTIYIFAGRNGNIYTSLGIYAEPYLRLPDYLINNDGSLTATAMTWGGVTEINGSLLFGASSVNDAYSGVWRIDPQGRLTLDNQPSTGSTNVTMVWGEDEFYFMGYSGGADCFASDAHGTKMYDNLEGIIHSPLYQVADDVTKATYSRMEVVLGKDASTGGQIRVGHRDGLSGSFTNIDTFTADGATHIFRSDSIGLTDVENIQIQVEMDDEDIGTNDIELKEVRLFP